MEQQKKNENKKNVYKNTILWLSDIENAPAVSENSPVPHPNVL